MPPSLMCLSIHLWAARAFDSMSKFRNLVSIRQVLFSND